MHVCASVDAITHACAPNCTRESSHDVDTHTGTPHTPTLKVREDSEAQPPLKEIHVVDGQVSKWTERSQCFAQSPKPDRSHERPSIQCSCVSCVFASAPGFPGPAAAVRFSPSTMSCPGAHVTLMLTHSRRTHAVDSHDWSYLCRFISLRSTKLNNAVMQRVTDSLFLTWNAEDSGSSAPAACTMTFSVEALST